jgi:hypothetical protein
VEGFREIRQLLGKVAVDGLQELPPKGVRIAPDRRGAALSDHGVVDGLVDREPYLLGRVPDEGLVALGVPTPRLVSGKLEVRLRQAEQSLGAARRVHRARFQGVSN